MGTKPKDKVLVVGSGPGGLAAAVTLARAGLQVEVAEAQDTAGGGLRTLPLTDGFRFDHCSAIHPMALQSPFFRAWGLRDRVQFVSPEVSFAHPLDDGRTGMAYRDIERTAALLGPVGGRQWRRFFDPLLQRTDSMTSMVTSHLLRMPKDPLAAAQFGLRVLSQSLARPAMLQRVLPPRDEVARAMLTGVMGHNVGRSPSITSAGVGVVLTAYAHTQSGWPVPVGGSQAIADALIEDLAAHGGRVDTRRPITNAGELGDYGTVIFDTSVAGMVDIAGGLLPAGYIRRLASFRGGDGIAKLDLALSGAVPWRDAGMRLTATVHLGGTARQVARASHAVAAGQHPQRPYVLVAQPSLFDETRAPRGKHTLWAYTHVPRGSTVDVQERMIDSIEAHAPGFRDLIVRRRYRSAADQPAENANFVGGDIMTGAMTARQLLARPVLSLNPWRTPARGVYLASAATPPGPAVHGMNGYFAAIAALQDLGLPVPRLGPIQPSRSSG